MSNHQQHKAPKPRKPRRSLGCLETAAFLALIALVLGAWIVPQALFRLSYGRGPVDNAALRQVKAGMTADEVIAAAGPPHKKYREDKKERWVYFKDSFGWSSTEVQFNREGLVEGVGSSE